MVNNTIRLIEVTILKTKGEVSDKIIKINQAYFNLTGCQITK